MTQKHPQYDLVEIDGEDCWCIKIKSGEYTDVVYKYDYVRFVEPDRDDGFATLKFNYEILYHAELPEDKFSKNSTFENTLGDILYDIIDTAPQNDKDT